MDLRGLLRTLRRERWPAVISFLVVLGAAGLLAASVPAQYRADTTFFVQPARDESTFGSVQAVAFLMPALEARISSRALEEVVRGSLSEAVASGRWAASGTAEPGTGLLQMTITSARPDVPRPVAESYGEALRQFVTSSDTPLQISVLDPPADPVGTAGGRAFSLLISGFVLAVGAAVVTALGAARIRRPKRLIDDVREQYDLTVLGEIAPFRRNVNPSPWLLYDSDEPSAIEGFMRLRTSVEIGIVARDLHSIAVVSRGLGEGKTVVSAHLAWSLASLGHRVLLTDADLRHAGLDRLIGRGVRTPDAPPADGVAAATLLTNLSYVSAQNVRRALARSSDGAPSHPTEVVTAALPQIIATAQMDRALVLVDSPPILGAAESKFIVSVVDAVIIVVDARRPLALEDLADTLRQVSEAGGTVLGIVLNRARISRTARREQEMYYVPTHKTRRQGSVKD